MADIGDSQEEKMKRDIHKKLTEKGEKDRLREVLREKLINCGWRDEMKQECRKIVQEKGLDNVTVDMIIKEVTHIGRTKVPDSVKRELLQEIRAFLARETNL